MKRIFVAIKISENLQERVLEWQKQHQDFPVRWIAGKNLHITLVPPWSLDSARDLQQVMSRLESVRSGIFEISFDKISFGPNPREPRLIWASGNAPQEIKDLRLKIYDALGQKPENKEFKLHITLARFKAGDFKNFSVTSIGEKIDWREQVESFVLMESYLSSAGADYVVLEEIKLSP